MIYYNFYFHLLNLSKNLRFNLLVRLSTNTWTYRKHYTKYFCEARQIYLTNLCLSVKNGMNSQPIRLQR